MAELPVQSWWSVIPGVIGPLAALGALVFSGYNYSHSRRTLDEGRLSERRKLIAARLNEFYGPMLMYLNVIEALYRLFDIGKPDGFRTLTYLLDRTQRYATPDGPVQILLSESDESLLREILAVEQKLEEHIISNCGLVEDTKLAFDYVPDPSKTDIDPAAVKNLGLLSVLLTHFRVLRMASEGKLSVELDRYRAFVYPRELDGILRERIVQMHSQLKDLGGDPQGHTAAGVIPASRK